MSYPRLTIEEFGGQLLLTGDLDPVYVMLTEAHRSGLSAMQSARWCLAYWCLYHVGAASYAAEDQNSREETVDHFWRVLGQAALNTPKGPPPTGERWPRGKERRHWRGEQAVNSHSELARRYFSTPEGLVQGAQGLQEFETVANYVKSHRGFGDWMAFKVADMLEQVFNYPIKFDNAAVFMFKDPKEAALMLWRVKTGQPEGARPKNPQEAIDQVVAYLQDHFKNYRAPNGCRAVGLQEVETILCKWKSHMNGHYPVGNDIHELHTAMDGWSDHSPLARQLRSHIPIKWVGEPKFH
jgi:hypothetical protein